MQTTSSPILTAPWLESVKCSLRGDERNHAQDPDPERDRFASAGVQPPDRTAQTQPCHTQYDRDHGQDQRQKRIPYPHAPIRHTSASILRKSTNDRDRPARDQHEYPKSRRHCHWKRVLQGPCRRIPGFLPWVGVPEWRPGNHSATFRTLHRTDSAEVVSAPAAGNVSIRKVVLQQRGSTISGVDHSEQVYRCCSSE